MEDLRESVTPINQTQQKTLLSPFTWNNISLPPLAKPKLTSSVSAKPEQNVNKLATI